MIQYKINKIKNVIIKFSFYIMSFFIIIGIFLLLWTSNDELWVNNKFWQVVLRELGAFIAISFTISLFWDMFGRKQLLDNVLDVTRLSDEIQQSGLTKIIEYFPDYNKWQDHFVKNNNLDIVFSYGSGWRSNLKITLGEFVSKKGNRIRVIMPDPNDPLTINELARRFKYDETSMISKIQEAEVDFKDLASKAEENGAIVEIWFIPAAITYSFYRFNNLLIFAMFTHRQEKRIKVPSFVCEKGGWLYDYFEKEFEEMVNPDRKLTRKVL